MFKTLKSIFSSSPKIFIEDFSPIYTDMHSHLLEGIDDGVNTEEDAIEIIRNFEKAGYKKIITTPHIMSGGYDNTPETILPRKDKLLELLQKENISIELEAAAEYYLDTNFENLIQNKDLLTFGNNYVLFELSYMTRQNNIESAIFELTMADYKPILAHPERYPYLADKNLENLSKIKEANVLFQINMFSLVGFYGKVAKQVAEMLIDNDMVDFIGTDIHNPTQLPAFEECKKSEYLKKLIDSGKLLNNTL